ncbi:MAG: polysaccharide deacetylase family protein [Endomicrobiia bacterium]
MNKFTKLFLIILILFFGLLIILYHRYKDKTFILTYHIVDEYQGGYKGLTVRPKTLDRQMKYLYNRGYKTIPLSELVQILKDKKEIPTKKFVLTFDDGYENFYKNALPILRKYGFTATVFITAGNIGKVCSYPHCPPEKHLSKEQIKEISEFVDIGAHSVKHPDLTKISKEEVYIEAMESKNLLEKIIKKPVKIFCYPFGNYSEEVKSIIKETGFIGACSTERGLVDKNSDTYSLPRYEFKEFYALSPSDFLSSIDFYLKIFLGL